MNETDLLHARILRAILDGRPPCDDPPGMPDPRPSRYCTFAEFLTHHATEQQRRIVARVAPPLAANYGVGLATEPEPVPDGPTLKRSMGYVPA